MNEDIFDGISIEQLMNFTGDDSSIKVEKAPTKEESKKDDTKDNKEEKVEEGIDISELANIGGNEEAEEENKTNKKPVNVDNSSSDSNKLLKTFASNLQKTGILSEVSEEELEALKDEDELYALVNKQIKANEYKHLTENQRLYLEALENGIPEDEFIANRRNDAHYKNIKNEDIAEDINLAADLIYKSFKIRGFSDTEAKKYAIAAAKSEDATETAILAKEAIIKYNDDILAKEIADNKNKELEQAKKRADKIETIKSTINKSNDIVTGVNINQQTKDKIFNSITKAVGVDEDGVPLNEVMDKYSKDTEFQVKLHFLYTITKGFTDFSKLQTEIKTKATKSLKEEFEAITNGNGFGTSTIMNAKNIASLIPNNF